MELFIDIYHGSKNNNKFLSVPTGTDVTKLLIEDLDPDLLSLKLFKKNFKIKANEYGRIGLKPNDIIKQIESVGYALHATSQSIEETILPSENEAENQYNLLLDGFSSYVKKWGVRPDLLCINAQVYSIVYLWSALGNFTIEFRNEKNYLFGAEVKLIKDFSLDFIWLEIQDVENAIKDNTNIVTKFLPVDLTLDDEKIEPYAEAKFVELIIPDEVLSKRTTIIKSM